MWSARLLVQIAEASLFAFLLMWFRSIDPAFGENITATIFTVVLGVAAFVAIGAGRWSDRADQPILPLIWCAGFAAAGLVIMSIAPGLTVAIAGYVVFGLASSVFLALHASQTLRVLPRPHTRGRDLGIFNLTNTVPSLIMPWLILALVPSYGFDALFLLLAGLAGFACVLLAAIARRI
jgi:MFS family permease